MSVTEIAILSIIVGFAKSFKDKKFNFQMFLKSFLLFFVGILLIDLVLEQFISTDQKENSGEENGIWIVGGIIVFILLSFARKMFVRR